MKNVHRNAATREPTLTVWPDIGCPWASLALHVVRAEAASRGQQLLIEHRAFPLELFNRRPTPRPIIDAEIVAIVGLVPELGWRMWDSPSWHYPVTTLLAMEAVQAVKAMEPDGHIVSDRLDAALRQAWYAQGRCLSVPTVIEEIALSVEGLDTPRLMGALERGGSRQTVYDDWRDAAGGIVRGSPHFFGPEGQHLHNPGVTYHWTRSPDVGGVPRFENYDRSWVDEVLAWMA